MNLWSCGQRFDRWVGTGGKGDCRRAGDRNAFDGVRRPRGNPLSPLEEVEGRGRVGAGSSYLRCATSIGANLVEARSGEARKDFIHKCAIAQKEAREALYWLRLIETVGLISSGAIGPLIKETDEILRVVTAITRKTKQNAGKR